MTDRTARPEPRRRFALSVRALMAGVLIAGLGLGWILQRARVQRDAVAAIERAGGTAYYGWTRLPGQRAWDLKAAPPYPKWLVERLGVDFLGDVVLVADSSSRFEDATMEHVARLGRLETVQLGPGVTDAGVARLRGLRRLRSVELLGSKATGASVAMLARLPDLDTLGLVGLKLSDADLAPLAGADLEFLALGANTITDAGLAHLKGLVRLRHLHLAETAVTDAGLAHLAGLTRLVEFNLNGTAVAGPGLVHLRRMADLRILYLERSRVADLGPLPSLGRLDTLFLGDTPLDDPGFARRPDLPALTNLGLDGTRITDAGLGRVLDLPALSYLHLDRTAVTDAGLMAVAGSRPLGAVWLTGAAVTPAGVAAFRAARPLVRVVRINPTPPPSPGPPR